MSALTRPSPNFGPRRDGAVPRLIVLHYTAMSGCAEALDRLCDPEAEVSAHILIGRDGAVHRLVDEKDRAWHAGAGSWGGCDDVNSASVGIELDNDGGFPFSEPIMAALEAELDRLMARWEISPAGVIAHSDMAPARKSDPGPRFDWRRLALGGRAVWPKRGRAPGDFLRDAGRFGYPEDAEPAAVLQAFRARFRPGAAGPLDDTDRALAADLAARFPVDGSPADA